MKLKLITSESVSPGHPDKIADAISDAILDEFLKLDPNSLVAVETMVKDNTVVLGGEIKSSKSINYRRVVSDIIKSIGWVDASYGFNYKNFTLINLIGEQSTEINSAVIRDEIGAGDQGFMTGYATSDTDNYMPVGIHMARKLVDWVYNNGWGPDIKSQVTVTYDQFDKPIGIHTILISTQHRGDDIESLRGTLTNAILTNKMGFSNNIIKLIHPGTNIKINPAGVWNFGGPQSDCGVTGRKIVVDQYGPYCPIGGGAFSGKDGTKVDRSGSYLCRWISKNIVAAGLANKCRVEIAYIIGDPNPASINITTDRVEHDYILNAIVKEVFPLKPGDIIEEFSLREPIYSDLVRGGHFGRVGLPWERLNKVEELKNNFNLKVNGSFSL